MLLPTAILINAATVIMYLNVGGRTSALHRTLILVIAYTASLMLYKRRIINQVNIKIALFTLVVGEALLMSYSSVNDRGTVQDLNYNDGTMQAIAAINDDSFYRIDKQYHSVFLCDSLYQGYNGTRAYIGGTGDRPSTINFYQAFGMPRTELNRYLWGFSSSTRINTIMNVKYILSRSDVIGNYGYEHLAEHDGIKVYRNKYALPLGYTYNQYILLDDFLKLDMETRRNVVYKACVTQKPVSGMNRLCIDRDKGFLREDVLSGYLTEPEIYETEGSINISLNQCEKNMTTVLRLMIENEDAEIFDVNCATENGAQSFRYGVESGNGEYYIDFSDDCISDINISISDGMAVSDINVYQAPSEKYYAEYVKDCRQLAESSLQIEEMNDNIIKGTISCEDTKMLAFAIPNDAGWHLYIDNIETEIQTVNVGMLGAEIQEGEHDVRLEYSAADNKTVRCIAGFIIVICIVFGQKVLKMKGVER